MRETTYDHPYSGRGIAWVSLILSVLALLFAVSAYGVSRSAANEAGEPRAMEQDVASNAHTPLGLSEARREASAELESARSAYETNNDSSEILMRLNQAKNKLRAAYAENGTAEGEIEWNRLETSFDTLEASLRAGSADALRHLETLIGMLSRDVSTDADPERLGE